MERPKWKDIPIKQKIEWVGRYKNGDKLEAEAQSMGWQLSSLERELRRLASVYTDIVGEIYQQTQIPESPAKIYNDFPVIQTDNAVIISDSEIPDYSAMMLKLALLVGMKRGIRRLIHAGDVVATDQAALNSWTTTWAVSKEHTYEEMIALTNKLFIELDKWFVDTDIIEGNHDDIIARKTRGHVHLGMMLHHSNVRYSRYSYLYLETSERGLIKVVHPDHFSSDPITLAQELYDVERGPYFDPIHPFETMRKCHIVMAHTHRDQHGMSKDGVYEMHCIGTTRDEVRTKYKRKKATKHRQWDSSFIVVQNGFFYPMRLIGTNWREELGDLYDLSPLAKA